METCCKKSQEHQRSWRSFLIFLCLIPIRFYQYFISPLLGPTCRFEPTCSHYAAEAIQEFGAVKGIWLAVKRLSKCHPWHAGGFDPVPKQHKD